MAKTVEVRIARSIGGPGGEDDFVVKQLPETPEVLKAVEAFGQLPKLYPAPLLEKAFRVKKTTLGRFLEGNAGSLRTGRGIRVSGFPNRLYTDEHRLLVEGHYGGLKAVSEDYVPLAALTDQMGIKKPFTLHRWLDNLPPVEGRPELKDVFGIKVLSFKPRRFHEYFIPKRVPLFRLEQGRQEENLAGVRDGFRMLGLDVAVGEVGLADAGGGGRDWVVRGDVDSVEGPKRAEYLILPFKGDVGLFEASGDFWVQVRAPLAASGFDAQNGSLSVDWLFPKDADRVRGWGRRVFWEQMRMRLPEGYRSHVFSSELDEELGLKKRSSYEWVRWRGLQSLRLNRAQLEALSVGKDERVFLPMLYPPEVAEAVRSRFRRLRELEAGFMPRTAYAQRLGLNAKSFGKWLGSELAQKGTFFGLPVVDLEYFRYVKVNLTDDEFRHIREALPYQERLPALCSLLGAKESKAPTLSAGLRETLDLDQRRIMERLDDLRVSMDGKGFSLQVVCHEMPVELSRSLKVASIKAGLDYEVRLADGPLSPETAKEAEAKREYVRRVTFPRGIRKG